MVIPSEETFKLIQTLNLDQIANLPVQEKRIILPCLSRMCLCETLDVSTRWKENRKKIKQILIDFIEVNNITQIIKFDYIQLENEVKKEINLRLKLGNTNYCDSFLLDSNRSEQCFVKTFEDCDLKYQMKVVLSELIRLIGHVRNKSCAGPVPSELFDSLIYQDECIDHIFFAISEMPNSFQLIEVVEALLIVKNGLSMICRLVVNFPDSFHEICMTLINKCEKNDEEKFYSINRVNVLRTLCQMNPSEALIIRAEAVELCRMPNLVVMLTLDHIKLEKCRYSNVIMQKDAVSFITGILLSNDDKIRSWFSQYIKSSHKKTPNSSTPPPSSNSFTQFRLELLRRFICVIDMMEENSSTDQSELILTEACIMLRLYCALRGVASMKFMEAETNAICRMIVCRPPQSYNGVRFVSFGLCMILAFPQLVTGTENEAKVVDWIKWLVKEESYFGKVSGMKSSFGEMLLLIAIHFHNNQMSAIGELVSSTIGIKLPLRTNDIILIKHIFTQEIFTEQTVTAHAVKVPVTKNLNDSISGFLPIHCIYQLLKSRAFTKNKVSIKDWIFNQICNSVSPIHHILPSLIEAYVNSILLPNSQSSHLTNDPITEDELNSVFRWKVYSFDEYPRNEKLSKGENSSDDSLMDVDTDDTEDESDDEDDDDDSINGLSLDTTTVSCLLTSQLLLLYYVLLYENIRLTNMKSIMNSERKVLKYSNEFISKIPIFYLVQKTRICQKEYGILMPPLIRLLAPNYPHLCLVKDWFPFNIHYVPNRNSPFYNNGANRKTSVLCKTREANIRKLRVLFKKFPTQTNQWKVHLFESLLQLPDEYLWTFANDFIQTLPSLLDDDCSRMVRNYAKQIWFRLNHIFPTKLWVMTINVLNENPKKIGRNYKNSEDTWMQIVDYPFKIFFCDRKIFYTPQLMDIILQMLDGLMSAVRFTHVRYMLENPIRLLEEEKKREEFSVFSQSLNKTTAVQLILSLLQKENDEKSIENCADESSPLITFNQLLNDGDEDLLSNLYAIQNSVCSHFHQLFIADPALVKQVTFIGFDHKALPMMVRGVPSMHIVYDFIPELFSQLELHKHVSFSSGRRSCRNSLTATQLFFY